ncbi:hypothetical protein NC653_001955 [Populus alba x Populus x berolinensis]|uniref:Uncharacterized protein n=1 Tax=Populus alba x Populus x berolinensis TaxID=444605 RepID=A0AAD6RMF7_9ROSI|nr:hypothetical protein NC653_001955 [Populus alba x Populus x berolinensis]
MVFLVVSNPVSMPSLLEGNISRELMGTCYINVVGRECKDQGGLFEGFLCFDVISIQSFMISFLLI